MSDEDEPANEDQQHRFNARKLLFGFLEDLSSNFHTEAMLPLL